MDSIVCECGCGVNIPEFDRNKRKRRFVNGHNRRGLGLNAPSPSPVAKMRKNAGRERKVLLIWKKGGQCEECSLKYDGENGAIFQFHHKEPTTKKFTVGSNLTNRTIAELQLEVDKCSLLCANCHSTHHVGEY